MSKIKKLQEIVAYEDSKNPWVKLYFDKVRFPNGSMGFYNRIVESNGKPGVAILPVFKNQIGMVKLFRYPVDLEVWEIPRGYGETENAAKDALRELFEETGLDVSDNRLIHIGDMHPNSGILDSTVKIFLAECKEKDNSQSTSSSETSDFKWFYIEETLSMIRSNEIRDAFTLCALLQAKLRGYLDF
jgi:ADP-ribose pyrophosphatase